MNMDPAKGVGCVDVWSLAAEHALHQTAAWNPEPTLVNADPKTDDPRGYADE
jgi:hypothetical protein